MKKGVQKNILIGDRAIGDGSPAFIIAEAGVNHNGHIEIAKKLIDVAKEAGADAVKFQMRNFESLYTNAAINNTKNEDIGTQYLLSLIRDSALDEKCFQEISDYCKKGEIIFLCTPWDLHSVDVLEKLGVPAYKIASADLVNFELLEYVASKKKPLIISTGMSTLEEIRRTVKFLNSLKAEFALLHCNSTYPSAPKDLNLRFISTLKEEFSCIVGYSGHELGIAISAATILLGAKIIERHITLDRTMTGPDHAISLEPQGITKLVRDIRKIEEALRGNQKYITRGEYINRKILGKSLVASKKIKKGQIITRNMITAKSPAKGLSPQLLFDITGKKAVRDMEIDDYFTKQDLGVKLAKKNFSSKRKWALIARPHDFEELIKENKPPVIEFHLSSHDLNHPLIFNDHKDMELIVHAPELWGDELLDLCSTEKEMRSKSIANINFFLEKVREVKKYFKDVPKKIKVVLHPGGMSYEQFVPPEKKSKMYKNLETSLKKLGLKDIDLLLENLPPFPWYKGGQWFSNMFMDAQEIYDFCKKNNYGVCYDSSHAQLYCNYCKKDPIEFFKILKPLIKHLHLSDGIDTDGEGIQIDEGEVPFKKLMKEIIKTNASISPEIWMGHQNNGDGFWIALNRLKKYSI